MGRSAVRDHRRFYRAREPQSPRIRPGRPNRWEARPAPFFLTSLSRARTRLGVNPWSGRRGEPDDGRRTGFWTSDLSGPVPADRVKTRVVRRILAQGRFLEIAGRE